MNGQRLQNKRTLVGTKKVMNASSPGCYIANNIWGINDSVPVQRRQMQHDKKDSNYPAGQEDSRKQSCWSDNKALSQSSYQLRMQQQREGCARASKLQGLQEVRDPLCPTVVQWEIAVAEWLRGSNFRERVGNEYVIGATQSFTTSDG